MTEELPQPLQDYLARRGFWAGPADFDFWYAASVGEWFWLHLRRLRQITLAVTLFLTVDGIVELDLYDLSRAPVHGLRGTIVNTPLLTLERIEPPLPLIALRLRDGRSHHFTLPRAPVTLADQWLAEALQRLHEALSERWHVLHATLPTQPTDLLALWPAWAGPAPHPETLG